MMGVCVVGVAGALGWGLQEKGWRFMSKAFILGTDLLKHGGDKQPEVR